MLDNYIKLLAQQSPTPAAEASAIMVNFLSFVIAGGFLFFGQQLLKTGTRPEKSGIEFMGFKMNLESTTGGVLIIGAVAVVFKLLGHFYK